MTIELELRDFIYAGGTLVLFTVIAVVVRYLSCFYQTFKPFESSQHRTDSTRFSKTHLFSDSANRNLFLSATASI